MLDEGENANELNEFYCLFERKRFLLASGPDGISARLLKSCSEELAEAWGPIYQKSIDTHVPSLWNSSIIIPVPKIVVRRIKTIVQWHLLQ